MSLCHIDLPKMQMPAVLHSQVYATANAFEGILELRKEKSRDAARSRRGKENYEFYELAKLLPLPGAITSQLDKASIVRLSISYLKLRDFSCHGDPPWQRDGPPPNKSVKGGPPRRRSMAAVAIDLFETHQGTHILQSLDGFAFNLSNDGRFLYISETVSIYLGLSQVEMTGSSIFDYTHIDDHQELAEQFGLNAPHVSTLSPPTSEDGSSVSGTPRSVTPTITERASIMNPSPSKGFDRCFCIRMKSTLTKRGVHVKSSGYRVVQILSHMRPQFSFSLTRKHPPPLLGLVALAIALPPPTITELLIDNDMFVMRLSPEFKITYCEPRANDLMDISADDMSGKNFYDYCHAEDLQKLRKAHVDLLNKGQVLTDYYRLLNKHGGYVWLQTCATVICNPKNVDEQNIISINYVLSGVEYGACVMDTNQLKVVGHSEPDQSDHSEGEQGSHKDNRKEGEQRSPLDREERNNNLDLEPCGEKRLHSPSREEVGSVHTDIVDVEPSSPEGSLSLLYHRQQSGQDNSLAVDISVESVIDRQRTDAKNSRRKMDKPRKRKREMDAESDGQLDLSLPMEHSGGINSIIANGQGSPGGSNLHGGVVMSDTGSSHSAVTPTSPQNGTLQMKSPIPEDLSVRTARSPTSSHSPQHRTITPNTTTPETARDNWPNNPVNSDPIQEVSTSTGSSVRDLEEVMNKHLPSLPTEHNDLLRGGLDYNPSVLSFHPKHKSTIQWIGSQPQHAAESLPATNFLRTLYANRESVIRSNVYNPRPQYYPDMQPNLLTPPGTEGLPFATSHISQSKTPPSTYSLMTGYTSNPISVSMASSMNDSYSMTPPSSVSPQDKYPSPFTEQLHSDSATGNQFRQYGHETLPIKPHAYPLPAHSNVHMSAYERSQAQYPGAAYYSATTAFPAYNHSTSPSPAHYRDATKSGSTW